MGLTPLAESHRRHPSLLFGCSHRHCVQPDFQCGSSRTTHRIGRCSLVFGLSGHAASLPAMILNGASRHRGVARYFASMGEFKFTEYFEQEVLRKRSYLRREWCIAVVRDPIRTERQEDNRIRFWAVVPELDGRYLRVVTLEDGVTIHNAFPDRGFRP
ncbi:MAG TPA: hypothetical protein VGM50_07905 [Gemmatimonadaceae bacterium]|jgi:hypothetical protein